MLNRILRRTAARPTPHRRFDYPVASSAAEVRDELGRLGAEWMYGFDLGHGVRVEPFNEYLAESHATRWRMIEPELHRAFDGRWPDVRALDFACNEGWWTFQVAALGAAHVTGFDAREINVRRASFVKAQNRVPNVDFRVDNAVKFDPTSYGVFDLVLCLGLLYHLEDPVGALRRLRAVTRELCVIETEVARPASIDVDRGPVDGLVSTPNLIAIASEPYYEGVPIASVTGISFIPTLAGLRYMLDAVGFRDVQLAPPVEGGAARYHTGDRIVLFARV